MKRNGIALFLALTLLIFSIFVLAAPEGIPSDANRIYKFNIIGVDNEKEVDLKEDGGKRIFVNLNGYSAIYLEEGPFDILDANGTDEDGARFQLPDPDLDPYNVADKGDADVWSAYSIYIRPLGKPGGSAAITTCADLLDSDFADLLSGKFLRVLNKEGYFGGYASVEQVSHEMNTRPKGKSKFANVTAELTTIVFKVEVELEDGSIAVDYIRVPIFDPIIENEYWEYDNNGLKLLQVWIYDNSTDVSEGDGSWNNEPAE